MTNAALTSQGFPIRMLQKWDESSLDTDDVDVLSGVL